MCGTNLANNDAIELLSDFMLIRGVPEHMSSDIGSEFTAIGFENGGVTWALLLSILSRAVHGRMAISRASMLVCELNS